MNEEKEFKRVLREHKLSKCKKCGELIGIGCLAWNTGSTEAGTPYSTIEIICECGESITHISTWYEVETTEEAIEQLDEELK